MNRNNRKFDSDDRPLMTLVYVLVVAVVLAGSAGFFFYYQKKDTDTTVQQESEQAAQEQAEIKQGTSAKTDGADGGEPEPEAAQTGATEETTEATEETTEETTEAEASSAGNENADSEEAAVTAEAEAKSDEVMESETEENQTEEPLTEETTEAAAEEGETETTSEKSEQDSEETTAESTTSEDNTEEPSGTLPDYQDAIGAYTVSVSAGLSDAAGADAGSNVLPRNLVVAVKAQEDVDGVTWDQVEYYGLTGWIEDGNLTKLGEGQKLQDSTGAYIYTEPGNTVSVYAESCTASELAALAADGTADAAQAGTLGYGSEVTVEEASGEWVKITSGDITGWVRAAEVAMYLPDTYYYANPDVNLRSEPDLDASRVGTLTMGTTVNVTVFQNGWAEIQSGSVTGWAALFYLTPCEDSDGGAAIQTAAAASSGSSQGTASSSGSSYSQPAADTNTNTNSGGGTGGETPAASDDTLNWVSDDTLDWE